MKKQLNRFGINDLSLLKFVSDRGPNFVKALKNYSSYFCFAHRLNNILVQCFYQNESVKAQTSSSSDTTDDNVLDPENLFDCSVENGDGDEVAFVDLSKKKSCRIAKMCSRGSESVEQLQRHCEICQAGELTNKRMCIYLSQSVERAEQGYSSRRWCQFMSIIESSLAFYNGTFGIH